MAYFLVLLTCFQFIVKGLRLEGSPFYFIFNPYLLVMPFIPIWLASLALLRRAADKNLLLGVLVFAAIQVAAIPAFSTMPDFPLSYLKAAQFFWGPALLLVGLLGLFRMLGFDDGSTEAGKTYVKWLGTIDGLLSIGEVVAVKVLGVPALALPWVRAGSVDVDPFRPWGLTAYAQPNALVLAFSFWLSYLYNPKFSFDKAVTAVALVLSLGGTGQIAFLLLLPLLTRRPFSLSVLGAGILAGVVGFATYAQQYLNGGPLGKFDFAYLARLSEIFGAVFQAFLSQFGRYEIMFGTASPTPETAAGVTHDWAYLDVFYAYGLVGLIGYLLLYGALLFLAIPREAGSRKRVFFAGVALVVNFHYGTLNYYVGQFIFASLAALQLSRGFYPVAAPRLSAASP